LCLRKDASLGNLPVEATSRLGVAANLIKAATMEGIGQGKLMHG